MCTVTYIPTGKGIYLTSNRDEHITRSPAAPPEVYDRNGTLLLYPRDQDASGTWIAMKQNGDAAVLLNGAFINHIRKTAYRKSRGLIFLDIIEQPQPIHFFANADLGEIEPFTLILFIREKLWECRWDGMNKHALQLNASQPYIWSSATLYDLSAAKLRKQWFLEWFSSTSPVNTAKVIGFHQHAGKHDQWNSLIINRHNTMQTVSITSIFSNSDRSAMHYQDMKNNVSSSHSFPVLTTPKKQSFTAQLYWKIKRFFIRLRHWEYWPSWMLYGPLLPYWCWLSIRSRSLLFFSAANPGLENSGFIQERKSNIYKLIPSGYYPRTKLCGTGSSITSLLKELEDEKWELPLIAKPDIGEKGKQVKLLRTQQQLEEYAARTRVDFLLQEYIDYPHEAGIFYYRMPGDEKGQISGIVGKDLLTITGDGRSSIESLLKRNDRFLLQLPNLQRIHGSYLQTVPTAGCSITLSPYGNHARGAKFIDLHTHITDQLTETIDRLCRQIPGFYYGRMDIKFNSWEDLAAGKNFSIIELNGAGSEPTHIYDPSHSVFFAWREICRHWKLMQQISRRNLLHNGSSLMSLREGFRLIRQRVRHLKLLIRI
ncbi:MAG: hypothetical protein DI535_05065 [Citrobacter freundii]|nr:MAG: hypothetical protein DI535_05065 [Citrobacter freundii]